MIIHLTLRCSVRFQKDLFKGRWSLAGRKIFLNIVVTKAFAVFFLPLSCCSLISQASQAHVTSVLCKLTFSQESRCRLTSNRWDFVWEIKHWGLRTLNIIFFTFFYKISKGDLPLMYSCTFWCEFIDLVGFFDSLVRKLIYRTHFLNVRLGRLC